MRWSGGYRFEAGGAGQQIALDSGKFALPVLSLFEFILVLYNGELQRRRWLRRSIYKCWHPFKFSDFVQKYCIYLISSPFNF